MKTSPVNLILNFVTDPAALHARLWAELPWVRHKDRPRSECWMNDYGMPYTYGRGNGARTYQSAEWHPAIAELREHQKALGIHMDSCFVNGYRDGSDSLGWHADDSPEMDNTRAITVISLGEEREIWFRLKDARGVEAIEKLSLPSGSILVMNPGMQLTHQHRIPKAAFTPCGPRTSMTFRGLVR